MPDFSSTRSTGCPRIADRSLLVLTLMAQAACGYESPDSTSDWPSVGTEVPSAAPTVQAASNPDSDGPSTSDLPVSPSAGAMTSSESSPAETVPASAELPAKGPLLSGRTPCHNLSGGAKRWSVQHVFLDAFRLASDAPGRGWLVSTMAGGPSVLLYPPSAPEPRIVDHGQEIRADAPNQIPIQILSSEPGRLELELPTDRTVVVETELNWDELHLVPARFEHDWQEVIYHPELIEKIRTGRVLRALWLQELHWWYGDDGLTPMRWADRVRPGDPEFTEKGVALETLVDLANRAGVDLWYILPHSADDDFIRQAAELIRDTLRPDLRWFLEVGNEIWNFAYPFGQQQSFMQQLYAERQLDVCGAGESQWPGCPGHEANEYERALVGHAHRTAEAGTIARSVLGDRAVVVLGQQVGQAWFHDLLLSYLESVDLLGVIDALAIAPYFGSNVSSLIGNQDPSVVFAELEQSVEQVIEDIGKSAASAQAFGLPLISYEGGVHTVTPGGHGQPASIRLAHKEIQTDPRMGELYSRLFEGWTEQGGGLFCHYGLIHEQDGLWGAWGLYDFTTEGPTPKSEAFSRWADAAPDGGAEPQP